MDLLERHYHWKFLGLNGELKDNTQYHWPVVIEVVGFETEEDAKIAASQIITRDNYVLTEVRECPACGYQKEINATMRELVDVSKR